MEELKETLKESLDDLRPSNATGELIMPFEDFVGNCEHLFKEETFKLRFSNLLSESASRENVIRTLIDNYQFGDMTRVFDKETNEEYVIQWEFE